MQIFDIILDKNKKETTQHGSFDFPLAIYTTQISKNILGYISWHWHEELQFCLVTEGTVEFYINNDIVHLSKGEGIFINVGQMHQAKNHLKTDGSYICIDFHPNLISGFMGSIIHTKYVSPFIESASHPYCIFKSEPDWQQNILNQLFEIYLAHNQQEDGYEFQIQILLHQIWQTLVKNFFLTSSLSDSNIWNPRIKKMIEFIHNHYMNNFRLDELSAEMNLSKSACCREFKKYVKCTIFEYLLDYRLMNSTSLLLSTNDSITTIAYQCGFGSTSYFIEKFRNKSGISPLVYRKEKLKNRSIILETLHPKR
jgi:AraC-like DNA-binding protein/mannose-6-phosphate isomerase-like protein (cupin superfamily)